MIRNWASLFMLIAVASSTAYAFRQALIIDMPQLGTTNEAVIYSVPTPTASELINIRRALLPKIEISEPLLVQA